MVISACQSSKGHRCGPSASPAQPLAHCKCHHYHSGHKHASACEWVCVCILVSPFFLHVSPCVYLPFSSLSCCSMFLSHLITNRHFVMRPTPSYPDVPCLQYSGTKQQWCLGKFWDKIYSMNLRKWLLALCFTWVTTSGLLCIPTSSPLVAPAMLNGLSFTYKPLFILVWHQRVHPDL